MKLYRTVGLTEMRLIYESGMRRFPARLADQPVFFPMFHLGHAEELARDWNARNNSLAGYVLEFEMDPRYVDRFERRSLGGRDHEELWVLAELLAEFNAHIAAPIAVRSACFGRMFRGVVPDRGALRGIPAAGQLPFLAALAAEGAGLLGDEVHANATAVFLHLPYWRRRDFEAEGLATEARDVLLAEIGAAWEGLRFGIDLPESTPSPRLRFGFPGPTKVVATPSSPLAAAPRSRQRGFSPT